MERVPEQSSKRDRGTERHLKLGARKKESQVIADKKVAVNLLLYLVQTARQVPGLKRAWNSVE